MTALGAHPQRLDLVVHSGDPVDATIPVHDADGNVPTGWPTGWSVAAQAVGPAGEVLHTFAPTTTATAIRLSATPAQTLLWTWPVYAARLVATITPPAGAASPITLGWIRLYRP